MNNALGLFKRLTEVEKLELRMASPARIEYLADTVFKKELDAATFKDRVALLTETRALVDLEHTTKAEPLVFGNTWKF